MKTIIAILLIAATTLTGAAENPFLKKFPAAGKLEFKITDQLHLPAFVWPRTLLGYDVDFSAAKVRADGLRLRDEVSGREVPFQLSAARTNADGTLRFAVVNLFADLPSGGERRFELSAGMPAPLAYPVGVKMIPDGDSLILDALKLKVRLPASRQFASGEKIPGPILSLNRGNGWIGDSQIISSNRAVKSVTTEIVESGSLFISLRITYQFAGGGTYIASVKAVSDYDYVGFDEEISGLAKTDGIYLENAWTNFHPTQRMAVGSPFGGTRKIDEPMVQAFRGEDPAFTGPTRIEDPAVEMLPSLTPYWPNGWGGNRSAAFWDEKSGAALGLFITDAGRWQDHEYAIWTSADTLKVKYRFAGGTLFWRWPLVTGTRATGLSAYRHAEKTDPAPNADQTTGAGGSDESQSARDQRELPEVLRTQYADLSLDRVKNWVLEYPASAKPAPTNALPAGRQKNLAAYFKALPDCAALTVARGMFHPVALRDMEAWVVPDFLRFREAMSPAQRAQATAVLLLAAYVSAEEEFAPMKTMLGGHPNFMSDLKFPMAAGAFLFPDHPMANEWHEQYEKFVELSGNFYVRPAVPQWEARAGRWTESIATYNWAFLGPAVNANRLNRLAGGQNIFATPQLADMGDYLAGILTAPQMLDNSRTNWPNDMPLTWANGFRRIHPPQGAHSGKRAVPGSMYALGEQLLRYRPLTAEHLLWGAAPSAGRGFEDRAGEPVAEKINPGTNPHLTSAKYTGYGIVLRAGVDTPNETTVYLQQVDKGPNYRWGYANQNGSGDIYFYAQGKSFSGHGFEDTGDRHGDDAFYTCNTGVYKNYHYSCVGMNELTEPFYDLDGAQFAEIVPQKNPGAYSWPEYQSRSVLLVGTDYFITYDAILEPCGTRFAWNSAGVNDQLPFIYPIKGGAENAMQTTSLARDHQRGLVYDAWKGNGDRMMLITHRADVKILPAKKSPFVHVKTPTSTDELFQDSKEITFDGAGGSFHGTAGVIRHRKSGETELALFHGTQIGAGGVTLAVDHPELGISAKFATPTEIAGKFFSRTGGMLTLVAGGGGKFFVDGVELEPTAARSFKLPAGAHRWQITAGLPEPLPPQILRTENFNGGATVFFTKVAGAEKYRLELSRDNGATWQSTGETTDSQFTLRGLTNGEKVHVRVLAGNRERISVPANEYPIYVSDRPPLPPDGLKSQLGSNVVRLTWGEVLGASEYRLYRRGQGQGNWTEIFRGRAFAFTDRAVKSIAAFPEPGLQAAAGALETNLIYEYAVAAVNGNGEGEKSLPADTNPASWRNWNPTDDLRFRRQSEFWREPWVAPEDVPPPYYPQTLK